MKYKKTYKIEGKIIAKDDVTNLIKDIVDKYKGKKIDINIEAKFKDDSIISDDSCVLFDHFYFEKLQLSKLSILIKEDYRNRIDIDIYDDNDFSSATVESDDSKLFDSVCHCVDKNINFMKKQNKIYMLSSSIWGPIVTSITFVLLEAGIALGMYYFLKIKIPPVIIYLMIGFVPIFLAIAFLRYVSNHYPVNQFYFSETSVNRPNKERNFLSRIIYFIFINIVLPIIISYFTK